VYLHVFEEVGLLAEGLGAGVALERLLARVRPQMHFDVGFIQKAAIADVATVHRFLLPALARRHHRRHLTAAAATALAAR